MAPQLCAAVVAGTSCDHCYAAPGEPCTTASGLTIGEPRPYPHAVRCRTVEAAWRIGYVAGMAQQAQLTRGRLSGVASLTAVQVSAISQVGWPPAAAALGEVRA